MPVQAVTIMSGRRELSRFLLLSLLSDKQVWLS